MKKIKLLICFLFSIFSCSFSYGQSWLWGLEGNQPADSWGMCVDTAHNCYLTGESGGSITFGSYTLPPGSGAYLLKVDQNGNALWGAIAVTKNFNFSEGYSVTTDLKGDVYETGIFADTAIFGVNILTGFYYNLFLAKYDKNGNVLWARQSKTPDSASSIYPANAFSDRNGNVFITGYFQDTVVFGVDTLKNGNLNYCGFMVKYDMNGNVLWAQAVNSASQSLGYWVTADDLGNAYAIYECGPTVPIIFNKDTLFNYNNGIILVKYAPNGNVLWIRQAAGTGSNGGNCLATDHSGNVYMVGGFDDSVYFGSSHLYSRTGYSNIFLAKYDKNGNVLWAKQSDGLDSTYGWTGQNVSAGNSNCVYVYGNNSHNNSYFPTFYKIKFGNDTFSLESPGFPMYYPALIMKLDTNGNAICGSIIHDGGEDNVGMAADPTGKFVYIGGDIKDTDIFGNDTLTALPGENPFIARWLPCGYTTDAINELRTKSEELSVFPNPFSNTTTIQVVSGKVYGISYLELNDLTGRALKQIEFTGNTYTLSAEGLAKGMYFIRIFDKDKNVIGTSKIVVQ